MHADFNLGSLHLIFQQQHHTANMPINKEHTAKETFKTYISSTECHQTKGQYTLPFTFH
jgi:hypothetical protein